MGTMNTSMKCCGSARDIGLLALRIGVGASLVMHGYGKLFGNAPGMEMFTGMIRGMGFPAAGFFAYVAALVEFVGGIAILLGLWTSVAAVLGGIVMLVAFVFAHKFSLKQGELPFVNLAGLVALACLGAGRYSLARVFNMNKGNGCCGDMDCCTKEGDKQMSGKKN